MAAPPLPYVHLEAVEAAEDVKNLLKLGVPEWAAYQYGYSRKGYWRMSGTTTVNRAISKERLAQAGYYSILDRYESLHLCG